MAEHADQPSEATHPVLVWDAPTRWFHWLAAGLVSAAYATWRLGLMGWHARAGYALLWLLVAGSSLLLQKVSGTL